MKNKKKRVSALVLLAIFGLLAGAGAAVSKTSTAQPSTQYTVVGDFPPPVGG
jgi:ABC-type transporter Mla subunit MlaD